MSTTDLTGTLKCIRIYNHAYDIIFAKVPSFYETLKKKDVLNLDRGKTGLVQITRTKQCLVSVILWSCTFVLLHVGFTYTCALFFK